MADLCTGGTPSAGSAFSSSYNAAKAFDDSTGTRWSASSGKASEWIQYDWGAGNEQTVNIVRIKCQYGQIRDFDIQGSNDGSSFTTIASKTQANDSTWQTHEFTNNDAYQIIRIDIKNQWSSYWAVGADEIEMDYVPSEETHLEDASLDLSAAAYALDDFSSEFATFYQLLQDAKASLETKGYVFEHLQAFLEAAGYHEEDLAAPLAAFFQDLENVGMNLDAWGTHYDNLPSFLASFYQKIEEAKVDLKVWATNYDDFGSVLSTIATAYRDLASYLSAYGEQKKDLPAFLKVAKARIKDLSAFFYVTDGFVLKDMASFLAVTDGAVAINLGLHLNAISTVPVFRSITAQKVSSVVHEVL